MKLGSVVHKTPYGRKSATPTSPQRVNVPPKFVFWLFLVRMMNLGEMFQTTVVLLAVFFKMINVTRSDRTHHRTLVP